MTALVDDIFTQARQGSMAAIIQVLNERLASTGVRTRAVIDQGILQLLCEAATVEQLEQNKLVTQVKTILEAIAPKNIRRVRINSRIVREQQLLWLEEINRDPENQLLWSELIILKKPNILTKLGQNQGQNPAKSQKKDFFNPNLVKPKSEEQKKRELINTVQKRSRQFPGWQGIGVVSGITATTLIVITGIIGYDWFKLKFQGQASNSQANSLQVASISSNSELSTDPFQQAVRLANQASNGGTNAKTYAEWIDLANRWQQASDLMKTVPNNHPRYAEAQERVLNYSQNSEMALERAKAIISP